MNLRKNPVLLALLLVVTTAAHAAPNYLLLIDESNPSAVTITATTNVPTNLDSTHFFGEGIDITNFFTTSPGEVFLTGPASNLTTGINASPLYYDGVGVDNLSGSYVDINPYSGEDASAGFNSVPSVQGVIPENFNTSTQALSGVLVLNLSAYVSSLPNVGASGDIYAGYAGDLGSSPPGATPVLLGQWVVITAVPEPNTGTLLVLAAVLLICARRIRSKLVS